MRVSLHARLTAGRDPVAIRHSYGREFSSFPPCWFYLLRLVGFAARRSSSSPQRRLGGHTIGVLEEGVRQ